MPNPDFSNLKTDRKGRARQPPPVGGGAGKPSATSSAPEKTASWGSLPGSSQPKDRSAGIKRLQVHPKTEGL